MFAESPSGLPSRPSSAGLERDTMAFGVFWFAGRSAFSRSIAYIRGSLRPVARMNVLWWSSAAAGSEQHSATSNNGARNVIVCLPDRDDTLLSRAEEDDDE